MIPQLATLSRAARRQAILIMERENKKYPERLVEVQAPEHQYSEGLIRTFRSSEFVCQVFREEACVARLSINRTHVHPGTMEWVDGITWDELQRLKSEAGFGTYEAVEIYPPEGHVVNVASIRHLWIIGGRSAFSWKRP